VRKLKLILVGLLALAVALLVTGYVIIANYPVEELKALIQDEVREATGRELEIRGGAEMRVSFTPSLVLEDVHLRNPDWASSPDLAAMRRFEVEVEAWPLINGDVVIRRLVLVEPVVELERGADGRASWDLSGAEPPATEQRAGSLPLVQALAIERGTVVLRDGAATPRSLLLERLDASAAEADGTVALTARGTLDGAAFDLALALASLAQIDSGLPFPLRLSGEVAGARLALEGQVGSRDGGSDLRLTLAGSDLAALSPLLGIALPPVGPYAIEVHVNQPAPANLQVAILKATLGQSDLSGTLSVLLDGVRPRVNGTLAARRLATADFAGAPAAPGDDARLFAEDPFPLELLALLDASLTLSVGELQLAGVSLANLQTVLLLEERRLLLKPLSFGYAGGTLQGEASLDASHDPAAAGLALEGGGLDLAQLSGGEASGALGVALDLEAQGTSPRAMASSLGGRSELSAGAGTIHNRALALASGSLLELLRPLFGGGDQVQMNCFVSRFAWKDGVGTSQGNALDSSGFTLVGNGSLDLRDETVDFYVDSASKGGLVGLAVPFTLRGSLADPAIAPDPAGTALGLAKTAGLVIYPPAGLAAIIGDQQQNQSPNPCVAAVQEVEEKGGPASFFEELGKAAGDAVDTIIEGGKDAGDAIGEGLQDATDGIKQLFGN